MKNERKVLLISVLAILVVAILIAVDILPNSSSEDGNTIRANVIKDCSGTPWFVGQQKGYFAHAGIDFKDMGSLDWSLQATALISGQSDVFDCHPNTLINMISYGIKVHAVALSTINRDASESEGITHWLVLNESVFNGVQDLVAGGYRPTVGSSSPGMCMDLEANGWFSQRNLSMDSFNFVVIPDPQLENALRQGQIDVAVLPSSFYSVVEQRGGVKIIGQSENEFGSNAETSLLVFRDDFIASNPDLVRSFIVAFKNAERWSNDHQGESGALTSNTLGLSNVTTHWYSYTGAIDASILQPWIDAMVKSGILEADKIKPSDLYTTQFSDTWINETEPQSLDPYSVSLGQGLNYSISEIEQMISTRSEYFR